MYNKTYGTDNVKELDWPQIMTFVSNLWHSTLSSPNLLSTSHSLSFSPLPSLYSLLSCLPSTLLSLSPSILPSLLLTPGPITSHPSYWPHVMVSKPTVTSGLKLRSPAAWDVGHLIDSHYNCLT